MSRERVRQIEAEALAKLRNSVELRKLQSYLE
ncbi:MAG: sigma factor-like helix-turn-helix DNA-binding protein [Hymenobacter sp.]|jgi:DNA-directed RNA polymerase sigma subunit (sigma70/sigma32)